MYSIQVPSILEFMMLEKQTSLFKLYRITLSIEYTQDRDTKVTTTYWLQRVAYYKVFYF